jgi:hypothetical protein
MPQGDKRSEIADVESGLSLAGTPSQSLNQKPDAKARLSDGTRSMRFPE